MKGKIFAVIIVAAMIAAFAGCSLINQAKITPPDWIQGSWTDDYDILTWEFSADNIIYDSDGLHQDFKALSLDPDVEIVTEETSSTSYSMTYTSYSVTTEYYWTFVDDTTITYQINDLTPITLHKD